jgi:LppP/LprE lipoprotein
MGATARSVRAERNRRRLPRRRALYRWTRRIMGLAATAAVLGVGVASYLMIAPEEHGGAALDLAPAATPAPKPHHHKAPAHKKGPKPLTRAQKAARTDAVAALRSQGYTALKATDYDPRARFRVLIGRPVGDAGGGSYAFFFNRTTFMGKDALAPTAKLRVVSHGKKNLTLGYGVCCPRKTVKVRFRLEPQGVHALDAIPPSYQRTVHR